MSPIGGITYRGGEAEGGVQPAGEQDARILAKPRHSVASTFRRMGLTVWVLKSSGSGWRGGERGGGTPSLVYADAVTSCSNALRAFSMYRC